MRVEVEGVPIHPLFQSFHVNPLNVCLDFRFGFGSAFRFSCWKRVFVGNSCRNLAYRKPQPTGLSTHLGTLGSFGYRIYASPPTRKLKST